MRKHLWLFSILTLFFVSNAPADPSDTGTLVKTLSEEGKIPENSDWDERLSEALTAKTSESGPLHPLTLSIIAETIPGFSGTEDPSAAAELIAQAMGTADRQIRRGIPQPRIRQEARRSLDGLSGLKEPRAGGGEPGANRGRKTARSILESLGNPGSGNVPFSSIPGMESGGPAIPGQGPSSVPERREEAEDSGNAGDEDRPGPPF